MTGWCILPRSDPLRALGAAPASYIEPQMCIHVIRNLTAGKHCLLDFGTYTASRGLVRMWLVGTDWHQVRPVGSSVDSLYMECLAEVRHGTGEDDVVHAMGSTSSSFLLGGWWEQQGDVWAGCRWFCGRLEVPQKLGPGSIRDLPDQTEPILLPASDPARDLEWHQTTRRSSGGCGRVLITRSER